MSQPIPKVLWVTSFNKKIYQLTGRKLVSSFTKTKQRGDLLCCCENLKYQSTYKNILSVRLDKYDYLKKWLKANEAFIPKSLGGKANGAKMSYWNAHASRWFRKVASLHYAYHKYGKDYDYIIWVDSDGVFKKTIKVVLIKSVIEPYGMFYFMGHARHKAGKYGYETGLVGFNLKRGGGYLLEQMFNLYDTGKYRKEKRWDDGYILKMTNEKFNHKKIKTRDIADGKHRDVINHPNPFYGMYKHNKGTHVNKGGVFSRKLK